MHPAVNMLSGRAKSVLLGTTILASLGALSASALAQDAVETVTVTGIRASLQSAQAIKQNSDQVVDSITAVDIGALPDSSVAEALQRVPGIQITRTDQSADPLRWAGYGNNVLIRGLSWVKSLTNGEEIFGAENGRTISFADISADLVDRVVVYKNPSAKIIEGGVGGTVDLMTRTPFSFDGLKVAASGSYDYGTLADRAGLSGNVLVSDRFNTAIGEIGALVSVDYQNLVTSNNIGTTDPYTDQWTAGNWPKPTYATPGHFYPRGFTTAFGMVGYRHMNWKQPRTAIDTTLQWRPNEAIEVTLVGLYTRAEPQSDEHNVAWIVPVLNDTVSVASSNGGGGAAPGTIANVPQPDIASATASEATYGYDARGYWNKGTIFNAQSNSTYANYFDTRWDVRHHTNKNVELNVKYTPNNNLTVSLDANYVDSRATMSSMTIYNMVKNRAFAQSSNYGPNPSFYPNATPIDVSVDLTDGSPSFKYTTASTQALADQSDYLWAAGMDHYENNYAHAYVSRADATYTFDGAGIGGWLKSIDLGGRVALKSSATRNTGWNWGRIGFQTWNTLACGRRTDYGGNVRDPVTDCASLAGDFSTWMSGNTTLYRFPTYFGQSIPAVWEPKLSWMKDPYKVWHDLQPMYTALQNITWPYNADGTPHVGDAGDPWTTAASGTWLPTIVQNGVTCSGVAYLCDNVYRNGTVNTQREDTYAGYLVANFSSDTWLGFELPVDGNVGLRVVHTEYDSGPGQLKLPTVTDCGTALAGSDRATACAFVGAQNGSSASYMGITSGYTNWLPSFNASAHLTDRVQLRLAYSQGLVRADLEKMRNYTQLGYAWAGGNTPHSNDYFASSNALTGTGSNPFLKPTTSENYDVSLEWYFADNSGYLTVAAFYKDVANYVMSGQQTMRFTRNGVTEDFNIGTYVNGDNGVVKGIEFAYQQFYDFLPGALGGLGLQANYTKIYNFGGKSPVSNIYNPINGAYVPGVAIGFTNDPHLPLEGMSNDSFNLALLYEKYGISARFAYNWRSRYLVNTYPANLFQPVFQRNYGQLDGSILYSFLDHYKVGIQASNLLKQTSVLEVGQTMATLHDYQWVEGERKFSAVVRANW